jgi:hypothetical protein
MLAYARALGDQELPQALEAINQALDIAATQIGMLDPLGFLAFHRAHTARTRGSDELVLASLELAEQSASRAYQDAALRLQVLSYLPRGAGEYAQRVQLLRSHLAGILDLRATVAEQADRAAEAARCRKRLTQLAPGGNISLAQPMDFSLAVRQLTSTSAMLDTRGMVQLRLGNLREARRDIDTSIAIAELLSQRFDWQIEARKHTLVDIREMELQRRDMQYTRAVIYYHRSLVHEALGMDKQAQLDRDKVVELGFQPSDRLL